MSAQLCRCRWDSVCVGVSGEVSLLLGERHRRSGSVVSSGIVSVVTFFLVGCDRDVVGGIELLWWDRVVSVE